MFTEQIKFKIEVLSNGTLQVRRAQCVYKDDELIGTKYHRHTLTPGSNLTGENDRVVAIANAVWTPAVVTAYNDSIDDTQNTGGSY